MNIRSACEQPLTPVTRRHYTSMTRSLTAHYKSYTNIPPSIPAAISFPHISLNSFNENTPTSLAFTGAN